MKKVFFYIGSNNKTKVLEVEKIEDIIGKYFDGFTVFEVVGYWKGNKERTLKVEVITEEGATVITRIAKELKKELDQESILVEILKSNCLFI